MNVLLIEPDKILAKAYSQALQQEGHQVVVVSGAQAAVHAADTLLPDVVVLELQLPNHNGVEFLYEFRSYSEWLHIPIIIHTLVPLSELTAASALLQKELGVVQQLYKPTTSLAKLCAAVRAAAPVVL